MGPGEQPIYARISLVHTREEETWCLVAVEVAEGFYEILDPLWGRTKDAACRDHPPRADARQCGYGACSISSPSPTIRARYPTWVRRLERPPNAKMLGESATVAGQGRIEA